LGATESLLMFVVYLMSGLGLFIVGMRSLGAGMQVIFARQIRWLVNSLAVNPLLSLIIGTAISFFIQSGTSTSTMAVSYASSGLLNLSQLIVVILGSNLGTALTVWVFIADPGMLSYYFIAIGVIPMMYAKWPILSSFGKVVFSFGLLYLGFSIMKNLPGIPLDTLKGALSNLSLSNYVSTGYLSYWLIVLMIVVASQFIRSTVALVVAVMALVSSGLLSATLGIIIVLGANLGRAFPVVNCSLKATRRAKRGALAHLIVNFVGIFLVSIIFNPFLSLIRDLAHFIGSGNQNQLLMIPTAHLIFNLGTVILSFLTLVPLKWLLHKIVPESKRKEPQKLKFLGRTSHMSPILAIEQVYQEIKKLAATVSTTLELTRILLATEDEEAAEKILKYEKISDNIQVEIFDFLSRVMEVPLTEKQGAQVRSLSRIANELESIADRCKLISLSHIEVRQMGVTIDGKLNDQLDKLIELLLSVYEVAFEVVTEHEDEERGEYRKRLTKFDSKLFELRKSYLNWLKSEAGSSYEVEAGLKVGDILVGIKQIRSHTKNIFEAYRYSFEK